MMLKNKTHIIVSSLLFLVIVCSFIIMALKFPLAYIAATYEDFFGEWAQVFLFVAVFIISLRLAFIKSTFRVFFIVLALASFYTFMEEISWGQRIFNIDSPEIFLKHNLQRETNIHNFIIGPYRTSLKSSIEYILFTGLILYGLIYPVLLIMHLRFAQWIEAKGLPAPPLYLWPFFVLSAVLELGILRFNEAEIAEILIPFALAISLLHFLFANRSEGLSDSDSRQSLDSSRSRKLALAICGIFIFVVIASAGATYANYASPRLKEKMQGRLDNGIEKFAGRYERYKMWDMAIYLYKIIDKKEPGRPSIQRDLAYCYRKYGNAEKEKLYIKKALNIDRQRLDDMPTSISAHLSIASTYEQIWKYKKELDHLNMARKIALKRVKNEPESASAAYWLGETYAQRGNNRSALTYYEKAFKLKPHLRKYRKAFMKTRRLMKGESMTEPEETEE